LQVPDPSGEAETLPPPSLQPEAQTLPPSPGSKQETAAPAVTPDCALSPELANHPRYQVLELLGSGGMGAVYKATHRLMQRTVALKVINKDLVANPATVERFHREVQAAARLHHPHIVTAHDAEQAGDVHFLVMEYVQGTDLHKRIARGGPLPIAEACAYVRQAALGLQHAMDNGMVHRDIKPQNLILTPDGQVKILDFGLAALNREIPPAENSSAALAEDTMPGRLTLAGAVMGTPDYMAPEQARDAHAADIRADIYSLGCTLYCLLTGEVPFPGGTYIDKIIAHAERSPRPVREFRKDVPKGLVRLLNRMLDKDPVKRPRSPAEVADALRAIETTLAPCPPSIIVASLTWIGWGVLVTCVVVGCAISKLLPVSILIGLIFPAGFIYKGVRTLRGTEADTIGNGLGSVGVGLLQLGIGLLMVRLPHGSSGSIIGMILLVLGVGLLLAGLLALVKRRSYLAWSRARQR
jgi:hypothetical protein